MKQYSLRQVSEAIAQGNVSAVALVEDALAHINNEQGEGQRVFIQTYQQSAREQAQAADRRWAQQQAFSAIDGLPVSIKDLFDVKGEATTGGQSYSALPRRRRRMRPSLTACLPQGRSSWAKPI